MNEVMRSKVVLAGKMALFSDFAVVNGEMRKYIRENFPEAQAKNRDWNFEKGAGGVVARWKIKGFMVLYSPDLTEVPNKEELLQQAIRLADLVRPFDDKIHLNIKREAKNG